MSSAQVWTVIGVLAAAYPAMILLVINILRRQSDATQAKLDQLTSTLSGRSDVIDTRVSLDVQRIEEQLETLKIRLGEGFENQTKLLDLRIANVEDKIDRVGESVHWLEKRLG